MENEIKNLKDLIDKLVRLTNENKPFTINATFKDERGISSVFFIGGKIDKTMIAAHAESFDALVKTFFGQVVKAESLIKYRQGQIYEQRADGSFKLTFKKNEPEEPTSV